jgi:hypothetical protein
MIPFAKRLCLALAIAAVACAQVFGVQRGYLCLHGDEAITTQSEHCHDDHEGGHDELDHDQPCEGLASSACHGDGETHHHQPLKVDLQLVPSSLDPVHVPASTAVLVSMDFCPSETLFEVQATSEALGILHGTGADGPPSLAIQVVTCQVILV